MTDLERVSSLLLDLSWAEMNKLSDFLEDALDGVLDPKSRMIAAAIIAFAERNKKPEDLL